MNNHPASAAIAGVMSGVAVASACLTIILALQNRSLQSQISDTRRLWSDAVESTADLRVQHATAAADLESHRQRLADVQKEIATLESRVSSNATVSSQPVPVRIFDGAQLVGWGWIPASPTNRSSLAGDGVATVFLDRRGPPSASSQSPVASDAQPAANRVATVSSSAYAYYQYPYYLSGGWLSCDPDRDRDRHPDHPPQPTPAPVQEVQPLPTLTPTPAPASPRVPTRHQVQRTMPQRLPAISAPVKGPTPFPQRRPTVSPIQPLVSVAAPTTVPTHAPLNTGRMRLRTPEFGSQRTPTIR